jgi:ATP-dependent DNA helicase
METSPSSNNAATNDGFVSNASLDEEELEAFNAPEVALLEEKKLREDRQKREKRENNQENDGTEPKKDGDGSSVVLEKAKYAQLDKLLDQSKLYTQFLTEQMNVAEQYTMKSAETQAKKKKKTGKKDEALSLEETARELCPGFAGSLRDYQLKGVQWLISLYQNGLNGILADQMGLGKTVQTIAFLCHMRSKGVVGPFLVLGPLSTLPNWVCEFEKWAPGFPAILYHGSKEERSAIRARTLGKKGLRVDETFPVFVTSYEIAIADIKFLQKLHWKYVVVDEGHRLKNMNCKLIRQLRTLSTDNKLLLTGTPLQNNLGELWSLLNFLLPDVFSSLENFESWFDFASSVGREGADQEILAKEQRTNVITKLHGILKPFLLRRVKSDVETSLPGKMEVIMYADMTDVQREVNAALLNDKRGGGSLDSLILDDNADNANNANNAGNAGNAEGRGEKVERRGRGRRSGGGRGEGKAPSSLNVSSLNNMLMQMRKNCNHPDLIRGAQDGSFMYPPANTLVEECGKMRLMEKLLNKLLPNGHKVLIFSQMTSMLDLMDAYFDEKKIGCCRIDGSISWQERQDAMKRFNTEDKYKVFLLSTRAGGLGINLTAADTCIIYDSDWNPHQDLQAMDRCHRIGQQKPVLVIRLATSHSVEGKLLRRANSKMMLERLVIKKGAFIDLDEDKRSSTSMGKSELLDILRADISLDDVPQSGEVDESMMDKILDRSFLVAEGDTGGGVEARIPYPMSGRGYEVVRSEGASGGGLIGSIV